jgi:hypothetical protein
MHPAARSTGSQLSPAATSSKPSEHTDAGSGDDRPDLLLAARLAGRLAAAHRRLEITATPRRFAAVVGWSSRRLAEPAWATAGPAHHRMAVNVQRVRSALAAAGAGQVFREVTAAGEPVEFVNRDRLSLHGVTLTANLDSPQGSELRLTGTNRFLGRVSGAGDLTGNGTAVFAALHSPGDSPAFVEVEGNLIYTDSARLHIELAGTDAGRYDRLTVAGDVTLSGRLTVSLIDGFRLAADQSFLFLDVAGLRHGEFANYAEGQAVDLHAGLKAAPGWLGMSPPLFITYLAGDGNDVALYTRPAAAFPSESAAAVPAPSTGMVAALLACLGIRRRRDGPGRAERPTRRAAVR